MLTSEADTDRSNEGQFSHPVLPLQRAKPSAPKPITLLKALRRRWLLAIALGILVAATIATAVWVFLPPGKHTAYAKLYMPKRPKGVLFPHPEDNGEGFGACKQT